MSSERPGYKVAVSRDTLRSGVTLPLIPSAAKELCIWVPHTSRSERVRYLTTNNRQPTTCSICGRTSRLRLLRHPPQRPILRHRFLRIRIVIKSLAALASVPAGQHHPLQQRRRCESSLFELIEHDVRDVVRRV